MLEIKIFNLNIETPKQFSDPTQSSKQPKKARKAKNEPEIENSS